MPYCDVSCAAARNGLSLHSTGVVHIAAAFGVVRFPGLAPGFGSIINVTITTIIFTIVFLGEEIGWRGYLLLRLAELTSGRRAALLTGAFHAIFHLPLLVLTITYQRVGTAGSSYRW
jgi:uncharacterized protein